MLRPYDQLPATMSTRWEPFWYDTRSICCNAVRGRQMASACAANQSSNNESRVPLGYADGNDKRRDRILGLEYDGSLCHSHFARRPSKSAQGRTVTSTRTAIWGSSGARQIARSQIAERPSRTIYDACPIQ